MWFHQDILSNYPTEFIPRNLSHFLILWILETLFNSKINHNLWSIRYLFQGSSRRVKVTTVYVCLSYSSGFPNTSALKALENVNPAASKRIKVISAPTFPNPLITGALHWHLTNINIICPKSPRLSGLLASRKNREILNFEAKRHLTFSVVFGLF